MLKIFIVGPLTAATLEAESENVYRALEAAHDLVSHGFAVYLPHAFWFADRHATRNGRKSMDVTYAVQDLEWIAVCDAIFLLPGADRASRVWSEVDFAKANNIPIFTDMHALLANVITLTKETNHGTTC